MSLLKAHHPHRMDHGGYKSHTYWGKKIQFKKTLESYDLTGCGLLQHYALKTCTFVLYLYNLTILIFKLLKK